MPNLTDAEIATLTKTILSIKSMMADVPENKQILEMTNNCLKILGNADGNSSGVAMGGSRSVNVTEKTKALFSWFGINNNVNKSYEPKLIGGSAADRMVSDWKTRKNKALFELFHLT